MCNIKSIIQINNFSYFLRYPVIVTEVKKLLGVGTVTHKGAILKFKAVDNFKESIPTETQMIVRQSSAGSKRNLDKLFKLDNIFLLNYNIIYYS